MGNENKRFKISRIENADPLGKLDYTPKASIFGDNKPTIDVDPESNLSNVVNNKNLKAPSFSKYAPALRYAPAFGSAANLMKGDYEPEQTKLSRIKSPTKFTPREMSLTQYDPLFESQYNKTVGNIINTSGGSGAAARANIQAAGINTVRAKAQAKSEAINYNNQVNDNAMKYNLSREDAVALTNTQIENQETQLNEQNRATAENIKRQDWAEMLNNLSNIGTESFLSKQHPRYKTNLMTGEAGLK